MVIFSVFSLSPRAIHAPSPSHLFTIHVDGKHGNGVNATGQQLPRARRLPGLRAATAREWPVAELHITEADGQDGCGRCQLRRSTELLAARKLPAIVCAGLGWIFPRPAHPRLTPHF